MGEIPLSLRSPFQGLCDVCLLLAAAELCLVRPMRAALVFLALTFAAIARTLPDDAVLSQRLVGTWRGSRHDTRYFADGTWMTDPQDYELLGGQNSHGRWRIENAKLIETWRFVGELEDAQVIEEIIAITSHVLKFRTLSQDGPGRPEGLVLPSGVYTLKRIPDAKLPRDK